MPDKLVILVQRLGPYHVARLRGLAELHGDVAVVEVCAMDDTYAWDRVSVPSNVARRTLFADTAAARPVASLWRRLKAELDALSPGVLFYPGWSDPAALCMLRYARKRDIPGVMMSDSTAFDRHRSWVRERVKERVVSMADAMLVAGTRHVDYCEQLGMPRARICTGYDVVDNDHFARGADQAREHASELRTKLGLPERYFLACGRFVEKKNWLRLLEAFAGYRDRSGSGALSLVIVGDGPLAPAMRALCERRGIAEYVRWVGFQQYQELPAVYALAAALVHASTVDQWGLVVNEALAAGIPVLVSERCGCAPDLVRAGENGWTFDPYHVEGLTALLAKVSGLSEAERAALGTRGREVIADWSIERFAEGAVAAARIAKGEFAKNELTKRPSLVDTALIRVLMQQRSA